MNIKPKADTIDYEELLKANHWTTNARSPTRGAASAVHRESIKVLGSLCEYGHTSSEGLLHEALNNIRFLLSSLCAAIENEVISLGHKNSEPLEPETVITLLKKIENSLEIAE